MQVATMWSSGQITSDSLYRLANVESWSPLIQIEDTLVALIQNAEVRSPDPILSKAEFVEPAASPKTTHRFGIHGEGTRSNPFKIVALNYISSAMKQRSIIEEIFGAGCYDACERDYHFSDFGKPGNRDLCEYRINRDGFISSVWFDLSQVTKNMTEPDPQVKKIKDAVTSGAAAQAVQESIRQILKAKDGCCWFSGELADEGCQLAVPLYFLTYRSLLGRRKEWREIVIYIPRSRNAANLHSKQRMIQQLSAVIGAAASGGVTSFFFGLYAILFAIAGYVVGAIVGLLLSPLTPPGWTPMGDWKKHPSIIEKMNEGWTDSRPA